MKAKTVFQKSLQENLQGGYCCMPSSFCGHMSCSRAMKLLPIQHPSSGPMDRLPNLPLSFANDLLWRYPTFGFTNASAAAAAAAAAAAPPPPPPASPLLDFKTQLPNALATDPRIWSREDVTTFLRWCEREFDLPTFDMDMFQMNGKALCFLTKNDLGERCPGAGDVLHNVLQMLVRDAQSLQRHLPSSPVTPTSRHLYPPLPPHAPPPLPHSLSPAHTHQPPTPNWGLLSRTVSGGGDGGGGGGGPGGGGGATAAAHLPSGLAHLMGVAHNSVTLSPAPSVDSQSGSPQHPLDHSTTNVSSFPMLTGYSGSNGSSGSNQSDSEEDLYQEGATNGREQSSGGSTGSGSGGSPPSTPSYLAATALSNLHTSTPQSPRSPANAKEPQRSGSQPSPASAQNGSANAATNGTMCYPSREFFPDTPEPNTNGRLLWDFLQQLLNDPNQRYTSYIAWKNSDTGVFKIVDPAGLAKLWGIQKNHLSMNYDKMSRALRYYYRVNILRKVQGERHCYQFLRNPTELKSIKNISLLRQQMSPTRPAPSLYSGNAPQTGNNAHQAPPQSPAPILVKSEPDSMMIKMEPKVEIEEGVESEDIRDSDELPTDLSMVSLQQQQQNRQREQHTATDLSSKFNNWESRDGSSESTFALPRKVEGSSAIPPGSGSATAPAEGEDTK